ncbi:MAG: DNA translocase FtsK [Candidatus Moraniibacteriota bacterium]
MYNKEPKKLDVKFVLSEIDAIKRSIQDLDERVDKLYASLLYEEVENFVLQCKTVTTEKIQRKFNVGYTRACYLIKALLKKKIIAEGAGNNDVNAYKVIQKKSV